MGTYKSQSTNPGVRESSFPYSLKINLILTPSPHLVVLAGKSCFSWGPTGPHAHPGLPRVLGHPWLGIFWSLGVNPHR